MKRFLLIALIFSTALMSCEDEAASVDLNTDLFQAWTHAFEEQDDVNAKRRIYRLSDSQSFAPARFRSSYVFRADATCQYLFLHPADAHFMKEGYFTYDEESRILEVFDAEDDQRVSSYNVIQISADRLVLELR